MIGRINLVLELLQKFKNIDEPYIKERLFAVAYGVLVKSADAINFKELGEYIYDEIFNQKEVYPNILLRDYAKNCIEFIIKKGINLDIKKEKIHPPYNSYFPPLENLPSNDEIESYEDRDKNYHQSRLQVTTQCDFAWDMDNDEWIKDENDLSNLGDILECADANKEKWIALVLDKKIDKSLEMDREVSNAINKNVTLFIRSYIKKARY